MLFLSRARLATPLLFRGASTFRTVSTLAGNQHIKVFPNATISNATLLSYLDTNPPNQRLAIGATTKVPPTPQSFTENSEFLKILNDVLKKYAAQDPYLQAQAQALAGPGGVSFGAGAVSTPQRSDRASKRRSSSMGSGAGAGGGGGGGASAQGGAGGGGVGGYIHLSDLRNPPDFGRIAFPEDILGSIEADGSGKIVGEFEPSGTYRILTNEGILGLSDFLRAKVIERLQEEERKG